MKLNIYKITYRFSEKKFKDYYTNAHSEELALTDFKSFRPKVREFSIIQVDRDAPNMKRLLELSQLGKNMSRVQKELEVLVALPPTYERKLATRCLTKLITQYNVHINGISRNLQTVVKP
jgi:hypothetical protein